MSDSSRSEQQDSGRDTWGMGVTENEIREKSYRLGNVLAQVVASPNEGPQSKRVEIASLILDLATQFLIDIHRIANRKDKS